VGRPRADLLDGAAWERTRPVVLTSLGLTATAAEHLHAVPSCWTGPVRRS